MQNKKIKWLIYTVLVGCIPILSRFLVWVITPPNAVSLLSPSDFIAFGLVLHISNINEIEHLVDKHKSWKTIQNGTSIAFIALYSVLFALTLISEGAPNFVNISMIKICAISLAAVSLLISFSVFHRISLPSRLGGIS